MVVRFPAGPRVSLKVVTSRKAPGTDHTKIDVFDNTVGQNSGNDAERCGDI